MYIFQEMNAILTLLYENTWFSLHYPKNFNLLYAKSSLKDIFELGPFDYILVKSLAVSYNKDHYVQ